MEKRLRSSLQSSVEEFLSSATALIGTKPGKSAIKTLIWSTGPSSDLISSLPPALHLVVSRSLDSFKESLHSDHGAAPLQPSRSPPSKRTRRASRQRGLDDQDEESAPTTGSETLDQLKNLQAYAHIAHLCISHPQKHFSPSDILPSVRSLHDCLVLFETAPALLSTVAALCEEWWKENLTGREALISQSIPYLLSRSLTQGKKADVRRVYSLRESFTLFDYLDESIEDVRLMLVRCIVTPVYLKTEEGRRFLAFMLGLNDQLAKEALALIKSQIPFGRKSILEAYAEVLFRAWKGSEGSLREEFENNFVQGLIEGAIHARSESLAASIRMVLGGFVDQRATDGVEKLLFRLAEPVLFRSLQVANSSVRQNALHLLLDIFPLEDPDVTKEVKDTLLDKQFFLLERLLVDECPGVRAVAVEGSCRILHLFWEVIPSSTITRILTKIIDNIAHDLCSEVRLSTINGIIYLITNPQSHSIMKVLLPRLGCNFLDPTLSVRIAVADLLLAVRDIRTFQFTKVVGFDALLSSLANDHPRITQKITRLLIPSYFPSRVTPKEACTRFIALIKRSPIAGARFCEFAISEGSSSKSLLELLRVTLSLALLPKGLSSDQVDGLFIASANICRSLLSEPSSKVILSELFSSEKMKCLLTAAASQRAQAAVLCIASIVSPQNLVGFRDQFIALITNCVGLSENVERQEVVRAAHKLIISCGWFDDLFGTLTNILQAIASVFLTRFGLEIPQHSVPSSFKKKVKLAMRSSVRLDHINGKGSPNVGMSKTEDDFAVAAAAGWQMKDLLTTEDTRNAALKSCNLETAFFALRVISQVGMEQCVHWEIFDASPLMAYTAFAIYISLQDVGSSLERTMFDHSLDHLLNCAEKLFSRSVPGNEPARSKHEGETRKHQKPNVKEASDGTSNPTKGGELRTDSPGATKIRNVVKMATSVLMFIADSATMGLVTHNQTRCPRFASAYIRHVISAIERHQHEDSSFFKEDLKEISACLKRSFTYAAKLLHLVLTSSSKSSSRPPPEAFRLSSDLLDLITSVESYISSRCANYIFSAAKPWLPVLILGLGCKQPIKTAPDGVRSELDELIGASLPIWLEVLGKAELREVCEADQNEQASEGSVFKELMQMVVHLVKKGDPKILDSVGGVFLAGMGVGLERADFDLVLGLVQFTCVKLLGKESAAWRELEAMPGSLREIYSRVERDLVRGSDISEDGRDKLASAKTLLRSCLQ